MLFDIVPYNCKAGDRIKTKYQLCECVEDGHVECKEDLANFKVDITQLSLVKNGLFDIKKLDENKGKQSNISTHYSR